MAIIKVVEEWRPEYDRALYPPLLLTVHKNLAYIITKKLLIWRKAQLSEYLSRFDYKFVYRPGNPTEKWMVWQGHLETSLRWWMKDWKVWKRRFHCWRIYQNICVCWWRVHLPKAILQFQNTLWKHIWLTHYQGRFLKEFSWKAAWKKLEVLNVQSRVKGNAAGGWPVYTELSQLPEVPELKTSNVKSLLSTVGNRQSVGGYNNGFFCRITVVWRTGCNLGSSGQTFQDATLYSLSYNYWCS